MTVDGKKKLSILQPMADAYEPSTEEGQRVFRKLQATLYEGAPSSPERALPVNAMTFLGLCCVAGVLALGSMVYGRHASGPASDTMSKENVADVSSPKLASSGTSREGDIQLPESLGDSDNSVPCVAVDDLPELVGTAPTQAMPIPARSRPPIAIASAAVEEHTGAGSALDRWGGQRPTRRRCPARARAPGRARAPLSARLAGERSRRRASPRTVRFRPA